MIRRLIITRYVGHTNSKPSGYLCSTHGYKTKRISYDHGAHDPGEQAALRYAREVILPNIQERLDRQRKAANLTPMEVRVHESATATYGMPNGKDCAHVVVILNGSDA